MIVEIERKLMLNMLRSLSVRRSSPWAFTSAATAFKEEATASRNVLDAVLDDLTTESTPGHLTRPRL